jgi:heat shock protein HslJ
MRKNAAAIIAILVLGSAGMVACGSDSKSSSTQATTAAASGGTIEGTTWTVTELNGKPVPSGVQATLTFDGKSLSGSSGCNTYNGSASFADGKATVSGNMISTMRACDEPANSFEAAYLKALPTVTTYTVDGNTLTLSDSSGAVIVATSS